MRATSRPIRSGGGIGGGTSGRYCHERPATIALLVAGPLAQSSCGHGFWAILVALKGSAYGGADAMGRGVRVRMTNVLIVIGS